MADYLAFYGLQGEPFSNAPVTRFYYESEQHKQALTRLQYALSSMKGLAVVVGDIGTGKTTLARRLLDTLPDAEYDAALLVIIHGGVDATWLLRRIAMQLGVPDPAEEKLALLSQLYQRLVQIYEAGKKAVVLIDEAQMLRTRELMEEFRGLLNLEVPERKLLSFVFFGLPEIDDAMALDPPLKQRVALKFHLEGLDRNGTEHYIGHRLSLAGASQMLFTHAALDLIFNASHGTPRVINTLCDNLLLEGSLSQARQIDAPLVVQVAENLGFSTDTPAIQRAAAKPAAPAPAAGVAKVALHKQPRPVESTPRPTPATPRPATTTASTAAARPSVSTPRPAAASVPRPAATPSPASAPAAVAAPVEPAAAPDGASAAAKKPVNLDDIDSLLASIRKN